MPIPPFPRQLAIGPWTISYDPQATRLAYAGVPLGSPETCGCDTCSNFAAARRRVYTPAVRALLERLGVHHRKEAEVYHNGRLQDGVHLYGGWFHVVGAFERGEEVGESVWVRVADPGSGAFEIAFSPWTALVPPSFSGLPLVQLEFQARAPWVAHVPAAR